MCEQGRMQGDSQNSFLGKVKVGLGAAGLVSTLAFLVLLVMKLDADARGQSAPFALDWREVFLPLATAGLVGFLWMLIHYCSSAPVTGGTLKGAGAQFYYNLLMQLLVNKLRSSSVVGLNQAKVLRDVLVVVAYLLIVGYSFMASHLSCNGCDVPYSMLSIGFLVVYFFRIILTMYSGFYSFHRLKDMAEEVRIYQESLDQPRLFDFTVPAMYKSGQRMHLVAMDAFLWMCIVAFATLGSLWVHGGKCESTCAATFHIYEWLLIAVFATEFASLAAEFSFMYFSRVAHIEGFDTLVTKIEDHHNKLELKAH